jgi:hypothetical protein
MEPDLLDFWPERTKRATLKSSFTTKKTELTFATCIAISRYNEDRLANNHPSRIGQFWRTRLRGCCVYTWQQRPEPNMEATLCTLNGEKKQGTWSLLSWLLRRVYRLTFAWALSVSSWKAVPRCMSKGIKWPKRQKAVYWDHACRITITWVKLDFGAVTVISGTIRRLDNWWYLRI